LIPDWLSNPDPQVYLSPAFEEDRLTLDFETDVAVNFGHAVEPENGMLMGVWKWHGTTHAVWGDEFSPNWLPLMEVFGKLQARWGFIPMIAHNAGYELAWIHRMGLADLHDFLIWDTQIGEYTLMGNLASANEKTGELPRSVSLDNSCRRRGWKVKDPVIDILMGHEINPAEMPRPWVEGRCRQDVESTDRLFLDQRHRADALGLLPVQFTRCITTPALCSIEMNGLCLDKQRVTSTLSECETELTQLDVEMEELTGGINWGSPPQVSDYLYRTLKFKPEPGRKKGTLRLTPGGALPTDKQAMTYCENQCSTTEQTSFVALRRRLTKLKTAQNTLRFFDTICVERKGIFYGQFNQTRTATHRLSSTGRAILSTKYETVQTTQLQNLANAFKCLFTARRPGQKVIEVDGSQLEFRVGGFLGDDAQIRADIEDPNFDAHCVSAAEMYEVEYALFLAEYRAGDAGRAAQRKSAKPHTFKPFYGGEVGSESEERWHRAFKERYSGLAEAQVRWATDVGNDKRLITPWGLRYYWPRAKVWQRSGQLNVRQQVCNYPVQALATAEIIPVALVYLWHSVAGEDRVMLTNTVHDSVIAEIDPEYQQEYTDIAKDCFTTKVYAYLRTVYDMDFDVPLGVGVCMGEHWTEGPEESWDRYNDGRERKVA
jgi:hypothetical protein